MTEESRGRGAFTGVVGRRFLLLGTAPGLVGVVGVIVLVGEEVAVVVGAGLPRKRPRAPLDLNCPGGEDRAGERGRREGGGGERGTQRQGEELGGVHTHTHTQRHAHTYMCALTPTQPISFTQTCTHTNTIMDIDTQLYP